MDRSGGIVLAIVLIGCCLSAISTAIEEDNKLRTVIGIDLGTSSSCVGVYINGRVEIIPNDQGNRTTPSWVAFTDSEVLIGEAAKNQAAVNAERTIFDVKRFIGRKFEDKEVQRDMKLVPYKIVNKDGKPYIQVQIKDGETKVFSPEEISAMILTKLKESAEAFLGKKITDVLVTVPAYFDDAQRQATKNACLIAGLNVVRVVSEPMAAGFAYDLHKEGYEKNTLVFDLGDGRFGASIMETGGGVTEILATNGGTDLGGEDFNQSTMESFINLVKRALSSQHQFNIEINSLFNIVKNFFKPLNKDQSEELNNDLFKKITGPVKKAMKDARLEKHQIDEIIFTGGSPEIPEVRQVLRDYFDGKEPKTSVNPDEAVAIGAAILGHYAVDTEGADRMC
ncbi:hypothetical protein SSX86_023634 [Deinandra increscens subsp. villosa]|uniref:Heat shock protein 70 n=1 Tax=Deinandra increscens subsp. villosa TaxID=3103831 RepID=A0AAP0CMM9_9ASTR